MKQTSKTDSSDMKTILQNIESLLIFMRRSVNSVSSQLLEMAAAVECMTLSYKLDQLYQRWKVYLPFHECKDVEFKKWVEQFSEIHSRLDGTKTDKDDLSEFNFYPDTPFCLDLSCLLDDSVDIFSPRYASSQLSIDVEEYLDRFNELFNRIRNLSEDETQEWRDRIDTEAIDNLHQQYIDYLNYMFRHPAQSEDDSQDEDQTTSDEMKHKEEWLLNTDQYFDAITNQFSLCHCLDMALSLLIFNLRQIDQLLNGKLSQEQYKRLSLRLYHRYCPDIREDAYREVQHWCAEWPDRKLKDHAIQRRTEIIDSMMQRFGESRLHEYIDQDRPAPLKDPEFGKFLFSQRMRLSKKDVKDLFMDCFRINYLNSVIDPTMADENQTVTRLGEEKMKVYVRLKELICQANWKSGVKAGDVIACVEKILNIRLDDKQSASQHPYTEEDTRLLWTVLTKRRNCQEGFRSLKLTWLNLVGYFLSRGVLTGKGRNLCYEFFPSNTDEGRGNEQDYTAVSKGARDEAFKGFSRITSALDKMLKLTPQKTSIDSNHRSNRFK